MKVLTWIGAVGVLAIGGVIAERFGLPQVGYVLFGLIIVVAILFTKR